MAAGAGTGSLAVVSLVIAGIGVAQPYLYLVWQRFFRRGKLRFYPTGNVEVGYNQFGPLIGLAGALVASHREMFVSGIDLTVVREGDNLTHRLDWWVFSHEIPLPAPGAEPSKVELAGGLMILPTAPRRLSMAFVDFDTQRQMAPAMALAMEALTDADKELGGLALVYSKRRGDPDATEYLADLAQAVHASRKHLNAHMAINNAFYWQAGTYRATMRINTDRRDRWFGMTCRFTLSDSDEKKVRLNAVTIADIALTEVTEGPGWQWFSAFAPYDDVQEASW